MKWRRRFWGGSALGCLAFALALLWRHLRPWAIGIRPDEPLIPVKTGFVSTRGVMLPMPMPADGKPGGFSDFDARGWARAFAVHRMGLPQIVGWVDRQGRNPLPQFRFDPDGEWPHAEDFDRRGWALIQKGYGEYWWIDREGREPLPRRYVGANPFDDHGWACVELKDREWGWIDRTGKEVLPTRWKGAESFAADGWARVRFDDWKWGWIDRHGQEVMPRRWDYVHDFDAGGMAAVCIGSGREGRMGWIDRQGREALPCRWEKVGMFDAQGWAWVEDVADPEVKDDFQRPYWIDRQGRTALSTVPADLGASGVQDFDANGYAFYYGPRAVMGLLDRQGHAVVPADWGVMKRTRHGYVASDLRHPAEFDAWFRFLKRYAPVDDLPPFRNGLEVVFDQRLNVVWRSDLHALRPMLLPSATLLGLLAALCGWRWRVAKRNSANPIKEPGVRTLSG